MNGPSTAERTSARIARRLALPALLVLAACPPRVPPPDLSLDPAALLAQVREAQGRTRSVRGEGRLRLRGEAGSGSVAVFVAAERPDRVHVQALDFFGNTASVLAVADGDLLFYDARERAAWRGPATEENLRRLVPLALPPAALAEILCGAAPLLDGTPVRAEPGPGHVTLEIEGGGRRQVLRVGPGARVERATLGGEGGDEVAFGDFGGAGPGLPAEVKLALPGVRLELRFSDLEANVPLDPSLFRPPVPAGARVIPLEDAPAPPGLVPPETR